MAETARRPASEVVDLATVLARFVCRDRRREDSEIPRIVVHSKDSLFELAQFVDQFSASLRSAFSTLGQSTEVLVLKADLLAGTTSYERAFALRCFEHLGLQHETWIQGLKDLPWTLTSAETTRMRLVQSSANRSWLVFVAGSVDSQELDRAARWLAVCLKARAEVICGDLRIRTSDGIPEADWVVRVAAPVLTTRRIAEAERMSLAPSPEPDVTRPRVRAKGWFASVLGHWRPDPGAHGAARVVQARPQQAPETSSNALDWEGWELLVRRATFPSVLRLCQVRDQMLIAEIRCDMAIERLKAFANVSKVDEQMLRSRAALLAVLHVQFPASIDAARTSWSFEPSIFQIQRSILGRDVAQPLGRRSNVFDPLLISLVRQSMTTSVHSPQPGDFRRAASPRPLVPPFPSASALRRHIDWLFSGGSPPLRAWESWLENHLPERIRALRDDKALDAADRKIEEVAEQIAKEGWAGPDAAIDAAAWLLELVDLERPLDRPAREPSVAGPHLDLSVNKAGVFDPMLDVSPVLGKHVQGRLAAAVQLLEYALTNSSHNLRLSALLLNARAVALGGSGKDGQHADAVLDELQAEAGRQAAMPGENNVLASWRLPVLLTQAYVKELCGNLEEATAKYDAAAKQARDEFATEIEWRAALGKQRVQLLQARLQTKDEKKRSNIERSHFIQRAQVLLEVQTARSPHLMRLLRNQLPTVFISYRSRVRPFAIHIADVIKGSNCADTFIDQDIDNDTEDFAPLIQQKLGSCQAVLMVVSENYFESSYCSYEWNTIMARCSLSGYTVPVYWVVCKHIFVDEPVNVHAATHLGHLVESAPAEFAIGGAIDGFRANFSDLYTRLMAYGISLSDIAQPTRKVQGQPDEWLADAQGRKALDDKIVEQVRLLWEAWGRPALPLERASAAEDTRQKAGVNGS